MLPGRQGVVALLEGLTSASTAREIRSAARAAGFAPLEESGLEHLRRAAEHWRLCRLGLVGELVPVLRELSALPDLEMVLSLGHDLALRPLRAAWTPGHPLRVATIARLLATEGIEHAIRWKELRWSARPTEEGLKGLLVGALFHDLGKLLLPEELLGGAMVLTDSQRKSLEEHPDLGAMALAQVAWPWPEVLSTTRHHHEKWDGSGYPDGLEGQDIPWEAQILALADFCDSLASPKSYREALHPDQIAALLRSQSGSAFNPILVRILLAIWDRVQEELATLPAC